MELESFHQKLFGKKHFLMKDVQKGLFQRFCSSSKLENPNKKSNGLTIFRLVKSERVWGMRSSGIAAVGRTKSKWSRLGPRDEMQTFRLMCASS